MFFKKEVEGYYYKFTSNHFSHRILVGLMFLIPASLVTSLDLFGFEYLQTILYIHLFLLFLELILAFFWAKENPYFTVFSETKVVSKQGKYGVSKKNPLVFYVPINNSP